MVLVAFVGLFLFLLYQAWQTDYAKPPQTQQASSSGAATNPGATANGAPIVAGAADAATPATGLTQLHLQVQTDKLLVDIALAGGEIRRVELNDFSVDKKHPEQKLALLNDRDGQLFTFPAGWPAPPTNPFPTARPPSLRRNPLTSWATAPIHSMYRWNSPTHRATPCARCSTSSAAATRSA